MVIRKPVAFDQLSFFWVLCGENNVTLFHDSFYTFDKLMELIFFQAIYLCKVFGLSSLMSSWKAFL